MIVQSELITAQSISILLNCDCQQVIAQKFNLKIPIMLKLLAGGSLLMFPMTCD